MYHLELLQTEVQLLQPLEYCHTHVQLDVHDALFQIATHRLLPFAQCQIPTQLPYHVALYHTEKFEEVCCKSHNQSYCSHHAHVDMILIAIQEVNSYNNVHPDDFKSIRRLEA